MNFKKKSGKFCILAILIFFLAVGSTYAQRLTGTIRGTIMDDAGEALPGVTIEIQSPALIGGIKSGMSTENGVYFFRALPPGNYTAVFSLPGFQKIERKGIIVSMGKTTTVDIVLEPSALEESVTVIGKSPVVDVTKSGISSTFSQELLENLPKTRYTYIDIMLWAPGVSANETQGEEWHSSLGSAYWSDSYLVDGIDTSFDYNGTTWVWNNPDIYQEGEVFSIGATAEYGNFQGAVVNVITKSGGNNFEGRLSTYIIPSPFVDNNAPPEEVYPYHIDRWYDFSLELSGPLKKDKIWYYGNFQYKKYAYSQQGTPSDEPTEAFYNRAFLKSTMQLTQRHKLVSSYQFEWYDLPDVITAAQPKDACAVEPGWYHFLNLMLTSVLNPSTIFELKLGGWYAHDEWVPMDDNLDEPCHWDGATGYASNGIWGWTKADASRIQANATLSYYADDFIKGNHDFKVGVQYNYGHYAGIYSYSGNVAYYDYAGYPYYAYFMDPYNYGASVSRIGVFADDSWALTDRLVLNLGLRFDHQNGDLWDVDEVDASREPTGQTIQGISNVLAWNNWSPRLGLVFQLTPDKKTILRANYGHYYEGMYLSSFFRLSPSAQTRYAYYYDWDTEQYEFAWSWDPRQGLAVGDDVKGSLCYQYSLGISRELTADFGLEVTFIYKYTKNFMSWWNTAAEFEQVDYLDAYTGETIKVWNQTTDPGDDFLTLMNRPEVKQKYRGLFITFQKRMSNNWQMSASFVISKAYGISTSTGQLGQGSFSGPENPNAFINNSGYEGLLQSDRTYMFKLQGTYFLPYDFSISASYMAQSGKPIARTISVVGMNQPAFSIFAEPRGSTSRLDPWNLIDLRIEKTFRFSDRYGVKIGADIFNLLNSNTMIETLTTRGLAEGFMGPARIIPPRRVQFLVRIMF